MKHLDKAKIRWTFTIGVGPITTVQDVNDALDEQWRVGFKGKHLWMGQGGSVDECALCGQFSTKAKVRCPGRKPRPRKSISAKDRR